ncbi:MAG: hypothetical protein HYX87_05565 [Chloroflexi bacterium]|nr:hypothetical protein [Chloroflexota bacterium]
MTTKTTTNEERIDLADLYTKAYRSWADVFGSFTRTWSQPGDSTAPSMENWFQPWWGYMDYWARMSSNYAEVARAMRVPFESLRYSSDAMAEGFNMYRRVYEAWFKGTEKLARLGTEVGRQIYAGEKPNVDKFFDTLKSAYDDMSEGVVEATRGTRFSGMRDVDQAVKKARDAFPDEQQVAKDYLQQLFDVTIETIRLSTSAMAETARAFSEIMEKGNMSPESYRNLIYNYGRTLKQSLDSLKPSATLASGYREVVEDTTNWAKSSVDTYVCWLEMNLKLQKAAQDSYSVIYRAAQKALGDGNRSITPQEFFRKWSDAYREAASTLVETSQLSTTVPEFIEQYTQCARSVSTLYRNALTPSFATREDVTKVSEELQRVKSQAESVATKEEVARVSDELDRMKGQTERAARGRPKSGEAA